VKRAVAPVSAMLLWCLIGTGSGFLADAADTGAQTDTHPANIYASAQEYAAHDHYYRPTDKEIVEFEKFFTDTVIAHETNDPDLLNRARAQGTALGFTVLRLPMDPGDASRPTTVIRELPGHNHGGGIYFLAPPAGDSGIVRRGCVIECPHARSDAFTGKLGMMFFEKGAVSAFFSSTMRRDAMEPAGTMSGGTDSAEPVPSQETSPARDTEDTMEDGPDHTVYPDSDPAHAGDSFFQAAHRSWMRCHPAALVIQFHGFQGDPELPDRQFDLILSNGRTTDPPASFFLESERRLKRCLPGRKIGLYGRDTNLFGALTNVQANYIQKYTAGMFWHLEMERRFRESLMAEDALRSVFYKCIIEIIEAYETH